MTFEEWACKQGFKHPEFGIQVSLTQYALMQSAWNAAMQEALDHLYHEEYYYYNGNTWEGDSSYSWCDPKAELKKLLTA